MKQFFTLVILFITAITTARAQQISEEARKVLAGVPIDHREEYTIKTGCQTRSTIYRPLPLLVIDGTVKEFSELQKLNPDDIVSIDMLKDVTSAAIHSSRTPGPVIIITTRTASTRKFIIKDFRSGEKIPAATIYFIAESDSIKTVADNDGVLIIAKLKAGVKYNMIVSSSGYKTLATMVPGNIEDIFLEKDVKTCGEVVVIGYSTKRRRDSSCGLRSQIMKTNKPGIEEAQMVKPVYPNPVQRNNVFKLELEYRHDETIQLAIISVNGNIVSLQSRKVNKGLNHLSVTADPKWSAGVYVIQIRNEMAGIIKQEKLIVQ